MLDSVNSRWDRTLATIDSRRLTASAVGRLCFWVSDRGKFADRRRETDAFDHLG